MLVRIKAAKPDRNVEILGINGTNFAGFNSLVISEYSLPWLQDTRQDNVWGKWGVRWRDVRLVDSEGRLQAVYNLTDYDLSNSRNFSDLMQLFLNLAKVLDSDGDHLPDDWEMKHFANLAVNDSGDADGDGDDNFTEYAFGSDPLDPKSRPLIARRILVSAQKPMLNLTFRRRAGDHLGFVIEASPEIGLSFTKAAGVSTPKPRNFFDGTG
ncbi:MAG: hypothetical protein L0Z50_12265, partial [Verrucomicrobiales bacterium]|nr:hypothetical protein [Verrucomicrobiales bacterium]